ncbi:MAG: agmatine deiminase family protein [Candidatus Tectomicrobia bacterium]|uniref:Agmatine deiminase family protein n=1 Tax=Tectimicrobiota bacterium TaxID=2528274 RepID=A0A937W4V0_UNCTE|nr:agmatine deiminase family protein [Candidatus Tectomicrobia bacterium]
MLTTNLPVHSGYRMPAEWELHTATWLAWPHNPITWGEQLGAVEDIFLRMAVALQAQELVHCLVHDRATADRVRQRLDRQGVRPERVLLHEWPTADAWMRDSGPIFVTTTTTTVPPVALCDWQFNAWGNKYADLLTDNGLPQRIAASLGFPRFTPGIVLEGGSIDVNGRGSCLTTEQCLLNPNRNPHLQRTEIEAYLHDYLGVRQVIWLGEGIAGDDTDGHIDDIARFVNPTTVVCVVEDDPRDVNYVPLQDNYQRLLRARDQDGQPLQVVPLPMPGPVGPAEARLPASYANFYIANGVVLVPIFEHPNDQKALALLQALFPERQVLGVPCEPLVWGLGAMHCVTQQQPAPASARAG